MRAQRRLQFAAAGGLGVLALSCDAVALERAVVDFSVSGAAMTHRASGFLHSIDAVSPTDSLIAAVKPQMFRDRPDGGNGGGIFAQYDRLKSLGVKHFQVVVSDGFNGDYAGAYPGDDGTYLAWENYVTQLVLRAKQSNVTLEYDIWNEPDIGYFWRRDEATFRETWKRAVNRIRLLDPGATIVGPSFASYGDGVESFLLNAKTDNVLPDVLAWHEFGSSFTGRVAEARAFMASNDIGINRISLNEIVGTSTFDGTAQWQNAGPLPRYFLNVERADIESVAHACWGGEPGGGDNCENGSLNGLLTADTKQPRSTYWVYERYAQMSGTVAGFTQGVVRNAKGVATFDGLATKDDGVAHVLFGRTRDTDGSDAEIKLTNLDDVSNLVRQGAVRVIGESIANTKTGPSAGPTVTHDRILRVTNGETLVPVRQFGNADAYFLKVQAVPTWNRDADGSWEDAAAWEGGVPNAAMAAARFGPSAAAQRTVSVNSPQTVGLLTFDNSNKTRIVGSSTLTMDNGTAPAVIEVVSGVGELDVKVHTAPGARLQLYVDNGATLKLGQANVLHVDTLEMGNAGQLDLNASGFVLDYDSISPLAAVQAMVRRGYGEGTWQGLGINSSAAASDPSGLTALGYADNAQLKANEFYDASLDGSEILIKYTYYGDADLNGVVDPDDFNQFLAGFQNSALPRTWIYGDFDYNGVIDPDDFNLFLAAFQATGSPLSELDQSIQMSGLSDQDQQMMRHAIATVPEPGGLAVLVLATGGVLTRRRRVG